MLKRLESIAAERYREYMKDLLNTLALLFMTVTCIAQTTIDKGWEAWEKANYTEAEKAADKFIDTDEGKHLKGNLLQIRGAYDDAIKNYEQISSEYEKYESVVASMVTIQVFHIQNLTRAKELAKHLDDEKKSIYANAINNSIEVDCSGSFKVGMNEKHMLNKYIPIVPGLINGTEQNIAFDTGGNYLVLSKNAAETMNIAFDTSLYFLGQQGFGTSKMYVGEIDELVLGTEVKLKHVPVTILEEMNTEIIIFGTNVIKEFYTTIDYPNNQFVFTTKDRADLIEKHKKVYEGATMSFAMWGDHYMMGKGKYNDKEVNMFFDSGLVVIGGVDGVATQSWLCMSKDKMKELKIKEHEDTGKLKVTGTNDILSFAGIENKNVAFSEGSSDGLSFGGVECDLLISHGIISKYAWTIDFETMTYSFK